MTLQQQGPTSPYPHPIDGNSIRLFQLHHSKDDTISASLPTFSLRPRKYPPLVAISYVWGDWNAPDASSSTAVRFSSPQTHTVSKK